LIEVKWGENLKMYHELYYTLAIIVTLYSILFATSLSSEFFSIMPDEFGEHLTRDQRHFLHTESLQILQTHNMIQFPLRFLIGFPKGMAMAKP